MDKEHIPYLSATELSRLIKRREVSPVEATEAYLERIERLDPKLNAYLTVCSEEALAAARKAEQAIARGDYLGSMHGIPFAVKDQIYTKEIRTTGGSTIFEDFVPDQDATVVAKLSSSGAVLLGKLNLTEFATSSGPHHQDSGEAKIRESTAGVSRKPSSDCKACGCSSKHLCGLTAWNT